jgi:hypothetical protein
MRILQLHGCTACRHAEVISNHSNVGINRLLGAKTIANRINSNPIKAATAGRDKDVSLRRGGSANRDLAVRRCDIAEFNRKLCVTRLALAPEKRCYRFPPGLSLHR